MRGLYSKARKKKSRVDETIINEEIWEGYKERPEKKKKQWDKKERKKKKQSKKKKQKKK